jgi:hypothetical protein
MAQLLLCLKVIGAFPSPSLLQSSLTDFHSSPRRSLASQAYAHTVRPLREALVLVIEGLPDKPLKAGQSYQVPARAVHHARSAGGGARVIATYVVEKGKPLVSPPP